MNLSRKCSDLSLSPLNIGGGTLDGDLWPLAALLSVGADVVTVAAISSISTWGAAAISSISSWGAAAISSGWAGTVVGYILYFPLWNCESVSFQYPSW